jgi:ribosomal protein S12 methylthiotransferase accessory factor
VKEPNNFVEHFIDSTVVISWKFFSKKLDYEFSEWDFSGTKEEEKNYLLAILKELKKEVYIAHYEDFGGKACRILVPSYSEIYGVDDLIWDNTNKALIFRHDILNIHSLNEKNLKKLHKLLDEGQLDNYMPISDLMGIEFDENTVWGQLNIGELKILSLLVLNKFEEAKELVEEFLNYNDNTVPRKLFYQALNAVLAIVLNDESDLQDYTENMSRFYGTEIMKNVIGSIKGDIRFSGLTPTNAKLESLEKHLSLIDSYNKLHSARAKNCKTATTEAR